MSVRFPASATVGLLMVLVSAPMAFAHTQQGAAAGLLTAAAHPFMWKAIA